MFANDIDYMRDLKQQIKNQKIIDEADESAYRNAELGIKPLPPPMSSQSFTDRTTLQIAVMDKLKKDFVVNSSEALPIISELSRMNDLKSEE